MQLLRRHDLQIHESARVGRPERRNRLRGGEFLEGRHYADHPKPQALLPRRRRRICESERWLEGVLERGGAWFAPLEPIAAHVAAERTRGAVVRLERLAYYDRPSTSESESDR